MKVKNLTKGAAKVKASRVRKKMAEGKALAPTDAAWLQSYEAQKRAGHGPRPRAVAPVIDMQPREHDSATTRGRATEVPSGSYSDQTWVPVAPTIDEKTGEEGAPAPVIEEKPDEEALNAAARKIGGMVALMTGAGISSMRQLAAAGALPIGNDLIAAGLDAKSEAIMLKHVAECGTRLARKYGVSAAWEYEDEATVAVALFGSAFCVMQLRALKAKELESTKQKNELEPREQLEIKIEGPSPFSELFKGAKP